MIDLSTPSRTVAGLELAAVRGEPAARYVVPGPPRLRLVDGRPDLQLTRIIDDEGALLRATLELGIDLAVPAEARARARAQLMEEEELDTLELRDLPVVQAELELLYAGPRDHEDGTRSRFVLASYGRSQPNTSPPHAARVAFELGPDDATWLEAAIREGAAPVGVVVRLGVEALRPSRQVMARIRWDQAYTHLSTHQRTGGFVTGEDVLRITEELVEKKVVEITAVQADPDADLDDAALAEVLSWVQRALVEKLCTPVQALSREPAHADLGTVGEIFQVGSAFAVKALTQVETGVADFHFERQVVVRRTLVRQTHLADLLGDHDPEEHIRELSTGSDFFQRRCFVLRTARPLADSGVEQILGDWSYGNETLGLSLDADAPEARLETWADASPTGRWTLRLRAVLAEDGELVELEPIEGGGLQAVLDLDRLLGRRALRCVVPRFPESALALRLVLTHSRPLEDGHEDELHEAEHVLQPGQDTVEQVFFGVLPGDRIVARPSWFWSDGRLLEAPTVHCTGTLATIPGPTEGGLRVQLMASEDFEGLSQLQLLVSRTTDSRPFPVVLQAPGETKAVALPLPDPFDRRFLVRVTRVWEDGRSPETDTVETDVPVVLLGAHSGARLVVRFKAVGPEPLSLDIAGLQLHLEYVDAANQRVLQGELWIHGLADEPVWNVEIGDPSQRSFRYRVTTLMRSGEEHVGTWTETDRSLVLVTVAAP